MCMVTVTLTLTGIFITSTREIVQRLSLACIHFASTVHDILPVYRALTPVEPQITISTSLTSFHPLLSILSTIKVLIYH